LWRDNDGEYFSRVIVASNGVRFVPDARSYYRRSGPSSVSYIGQSEKKLNSVFLSIQLHIQYLLSLEDSGRTRRACVNYLQSWLPRYYPERPDIVNRLSSLAVALGGELARPNLSWKYAWIEHTLGFHSAKRARSVVRRAKEGCARTWDRALFRLESDSSWR
jgi:hypothetical protein